MPSNHTNEYISEYALTWGNSGAEKGEVFTKPEIVDFMIQTSGISDSLLENNTKILEPSCGHGEFIIAIVETLCQKIKTIKQNKNIEAEQFKELITAYDISSENIEIAKEKIFQLLKSEFSDSDANMLSNQWFKNSDFLLCNSKDTYTHIIGNPPYVRIENIPHDLLNAYRKKFSSMKERADLYIAFYEKSLFQLENDGILSFICTDRWTKNKYGAPLRKYISDAYQLDLYVDLYGQNAYQSDVLTYPAITQLSRQKNNRTIIIHKPEINRILSKNVKEVLLDNNKNLEGAIIRENVINGSSPWLFGSNDKLNFIKRLEENFPLIEDANCHVYIGAATGNNKVYIIDNNIDIEPSRKLPMVKASDIENGKLKDSGKFIINTYDDDGIIDLETYPRLEKYLKNYEDELKSRYIAKQSPSKWFKTIDRVSPQRAQSEKLLIPDIKSKLTVVYDEGVFHPNNSIYYIISKDWNLRALQAILISGIGQLFVEAYTTKISGGNLRFQAQHLRRIRIPLWENIPLDLKAKLEKAGRDIDVTTAKKLVCNIYKLTDNEKLILDY